MSNTLQILYPSLIPRDLFSLLLLLLRRYPFARMELQYHWRLEP